jgi:hypothetical protein
LHNVHQTNYIKKKNIIGTFLVGTGKN